MNSKTEYLEKIIKNNKKSLHKFDSNITKLNVLLINDIIFDNNSHLVSVFKDFLIFEESLEFIRR